MSRGVEGKTPGQPASPGRSVFEIYGSSCAEHNVSHEPVWFAGVMAMAA